MSQQVEPRERLLWGVALRFGPGRPDTLLTLLWERAYRAEGMPQGTAMPTLLFVSRATARAWCKQHNAVLAMSANHRHLRTRPVRVAETVRAA